MNEWTIDFSGTLIGGLRRYACRFGNNLKGADRDASHELKQSTCQNSMCSKAGLKKFMTMVIAL